MLRIRFNRKNLSMDRNVDLSIIIVSYNARKLLYDCLHSIYDQTKKITFEVIVVDNNSNDESQEMVKNTFKQVRLICNTENKGFAVANNQAIQYATGKYVLLLNSDTVILDDAITASFNFLEQNANVDILGCKQLNSDLSHQPSCRSFPTLWNLFVESTFLYIPFKRTRIFGSYHMTHFNYTTPMPVDVVMGAFMMIRKKVIDTIGLFDEEYFMYAEETDFCFRAKNHGFKTYYYPGASIIHYGGGSTHNMPLFFQQIHQAQLLYIKKNYKGVYRYLCIFVKLLGIVIRGPIYLLCGIALFNNSLIHKSKIYFSLLKNLKIQ